LALESVGVDIDHRITAPCKQHGNLRAKPARCASDEHEDVHDGRDVREMHLPNEVVGP
jgi:hypothetical protein